MTSGLTEHDSRKQLADFYHLIDFLGWSELVFNHVSLRLPGEVPAYLVNPFGLCYDEITPDNLVVVNVAGHQIGNGDHVANPAGFALHGAIHAARADVHCVAHVHTAMISAVANKVDGFSCDTFYGAQLTGRIAYHDFEGVTLYPDEGARMIASLGNRDVLVLRNHGVAVCGPDVASTFMLLWTVHLAAHVQVLTQSMTGEQIILPYAVRESCVKDARRVMAAGAGPQMVFDAAVRRMRRIQQVNGSAH